MTTEKENGPESAAATAASIGAWLLARLEGAAPQYVYQSRVVTDIRSTFGEHWSYRNDNGNWAIDKEILKEFGKLKHPNIQWDRGNQAWHVVSDEKLAHIENRAELRKLRKEELAKLKKDSAQ